MICICWRIICRYPLLRDLTPETVVFPEDADLAVELERLGWDGFFIKDYVKSIKTSAGSLIRSAGEAKRVVEDMRRYRGVIEGGFCVRRVERFREIRGTPFAPSGHRVPDIVREVAGRISHPFFSVDAATAESGERRIVEIGDGQVSDLVGWSVDDFVRMWRETA